MTLDINVQRLATRNRTLAQELHLSVPGGVIHTIMGTSGSGKSSLLAAVCGTLDESLTFEGRVTLNGRRIDQLPTEQRRVGILFQEDLLFAHMNVLVETRVAVAGSAKTMVVGEGTCVGGSGVAAGDDGVAAAFVVVPVSLFAVPFS